MITIPFAAVQSALVAQQKDIRKLHDEWKKQNYLSWRYFLVKVKEERDAADELAIEREKVYCEIFNV